MSKPVTIEDIYELFRASQAETDRYGYKKGLFVIKPSGDTVAIINKDGFKPEIW